MSERDAVTPGADVVILTALRLEFDAVLAVDAGAVEDTGWEVAASANGLPVAFRSFVSASGRPLRIAAAVSADMGATAAVHALLPLVEALRPRCVAMCGVCAAPRGKTQLGDVVAAERLFFQDTGKQLPDRVLQDLTTYKMRDDWKIALERLDPVAQFRDADWFRRRPLTTEWRAHRALIALRDGGSEPWSAVEPGLDAAAWKRIVGALRQRRLLAASGRELTTKGRRVAEDLLFEYQGKLPDLSPTGTFQPFRLHVAPMGSGSRVIEDEKIWASVSQAMRKTLGIDMEAAVLGELAHRQRDDRLDVLVMKGVMDFADHGRDDHFKEFAARASAECLLWFLRQQLATERTEGADGAGTPKMSSPATTTRAPRIARDRLDYGIERQRHVGFVGRGSVLAELDRLLLHDADGARLISGSWDRTLKIWDLEAKCLLATLEGHGGGVRSCAVTRDGRVVSASSDGTLRVWDASTYRLLITLEGHAKGVNACAVTPDGLRAASASDDNHVKLWDLGTGRMLTTLAGHTQGVSSCAVTADGRFLVSASFDNTLRVWDLATSECLAIHRGDTFFTAVAATTKTICAGDAAGTMWFLDWPRSLLLPR